MSRFAFTSAAYGPLVLQTLMNDTTAESAFAGDDAALTALQAARKNKTFLQRLETGGATQEDMKTYGRAIFSAFAHLTDPSAKSGSPWKYLNWICRAYAEATARKNPVLAEDLYKIRQHLEDFDAFKNYLPPEKHSIDSIQDYPALLALLRPWQQKRDATKAAKEKVNETILAESSIVYDGPEGKIIVPHTKNAAIFWGRQTRWCISATRSENHFDAYNAKAPVYIYLPIPSDLERTRIDNYSSFKFAATQDLFFDELDQKISVLLPCMDRLIVAASKNMNIIEKEHFFKHGATKHLRPIAPSAGELWTDKTEMLTAMSQGVNAYVFASKELREDMEVIMACLENDNAEAFKNIPEPLRQDRDFVLQRIHINADILPYLPDHFRNDREIALIACRKNMHNMQYVSPSLLHDRNFMLAVTENEQQFNRYYYHSVYAPNALKTDQEFILALIKSEKDRFYKKMILTHVAFDSLKKNRDFMMQAHRLIGSDILGNIFKECAVGPLKKEKFLPLRARLRWDKLFPQQQQPSTAAPAPA